MKVISIAAALVGSASFVAAQGVTSAISPKATAPAGCSPSFEGTFEITVAKVAGGAEKRDEPIAKRAECSGSGILVSTLSGGTLLDAQKRTGYIASNYQFQYDGPAQAGAIYTSGFSACSNGSLALGGSAVFYECESGDFYNLYDRSWAPQCSPVEIIILPCGGSNAAATSAAATQIPDGQVVGTQIITTTIVSALSDGQPQVKTATTGIPLCEVSQIADGQVQVATTPCASITSTKAATTATAATGAPAPVTTHETTAAATSATHAPLPPPVSQFSDGQIQVTPAASVPTVSSAAASLSTPAGTAASSLASSVKSSGTATTSSGATGTSAPATAGAAAVGVSSIAALLVGLVGAVAFL